jgi:hypothetical protein
VQILAVEGPVGSPDTPAGCTDVQAALRRRTVGSDRESRNPAGGVVVVSAAELVQDARIRGFVGRPELQPLARVMTVRRLQLRVRAFACRKPA